MRANRVRMRLPCFRNTLKALKEFILLFFLIALQSFEPGDEYSRISILFPTDPKPHKNRFGQGHKGSAFMAQNPGIQIGAYHVKKIIKIWATLLKTNAFPRAQTQNGNKMLILIKILTFYYGFRKYREADLLSDNRLDSCPYFFKNCI